MNQRLIPCMRSLISIVELLPMQQIPYSETEKNSAISANAKDKTKYVQRALHGRAETRKLPLSVGNISRVSNMFS